MARSEDVEERREAAYELYSNFTVLLDKKQAWEDLHRLTYDGEDVVRLDAGYAIVGIFTIVPDKEQAWKDLIRLTQDGEINVGWGAADALGSVFAYVHDRKQAQDDLHRLIQDDENFGRWGVANALGGAFADVPDKNQAWNDLQRLTQDEDSNVRTFANYSLGKASIFKATEVENKEDFKRELEIAIKFFENSNEEVFLFEPARFCLPFYRSFYTLTFKKEEAELEIQRNLNEARRAVEGSKSKAILLEAINNLFDALNEAHKPKNLIEIQSDLNAYRRYIERAADVLNVAEDRVPVAARLVRKGLPIINEKIKRIIVEIQEKAKALCKQTKGTTFEDLGKNVYHISLSAICARTSEINVGEACGLLKRANNEPILENRIQLMDEAISEILPYTGNMPKIQISNSNNVQVGIGTNIIQNQDSNPPQKKVPKKSKPSKKPIKIEPPTPKEPIKPPTPYLSELESEIADIFKSVYQKDRKAGVSEVNAKTLESLKHKIHDLKASGNDINWLDMGCGDGRCLEVLDDIHDRGNIYYHGIDISHKFLDDVQMRARKYGIRSNIETMNTAAMKFDSEK